MEGGGVGLDNPGGDSSGGFVSMCAVLICYLTRARARTHADLTLVLPP